MTVTVLALVTVDEEAQFELSEYFRVTTVLLERAGAKIIQRFFVNEAIVGRRPSRTLIIVEYPSRAAVDYVFKSPEYMAIVPVRDIAFPTYQISIVDTIESDHMSSETNEANEEVAAEI